jgi:hypothetical protein
MGLLISQAGSIGFPVQGTDISLSEIYARVEFVCKSDGITIVVAMSVYSNKSIFNAGLQPLMTDIPYRNCIIQIGEGETQSLDTVLNYLSNMLLNDGFLVEIESKK